MQRDAGLELSRRCQHALQFLQPKDLTISYGARRISFAAIVNSDDAAAKTDTAEVRGPREGAPESAVDGFLKKFGGDREGLSIENGYYILRRTLTPTSAKQIIERDLVQFLQNFPWPKSMRWGQSGEFTWVRPLRHIICLLDGIVVPIRLGPVTASDQTEGHRFLSPGKFQISSAKKWYDGLRARHVIADPDERRKLIVDGLKERAEDLQLEIVTDNNLVDEVNGLVEWPVPLIGKIDVDFMDLPPEVRELSMKVNQRYFAVRDRDGKPAPYFAFVSNMLAIDRGKAIIAGNERVLRARLSDARHFWDQDLKTPLDDLLPKLEKVIFHAKIGTQGDRAREISKLAAKIADELNADGYESEQARWAGLLSKADLVTGMVGEFPELQGIMGGYYAERSMRGWNGTLVGPAISTHYQPKGPSDSVPTGTIAISVALADKIYTLRQFFQINEKPTGSGDPYALRRAALGVIRIILENNLRLPLNKFLEDNDDLFAFIVERLRVKLKSEGKRFDVLDAVLATRRNDDLLRMMQRVTDVTNFLTTESGQSLLTAYRRAANILRIEDAIDGPHTPAQSSSTLATREEEYLQRALEQLSAEAWDAFNAGDFLPYIAWLSTLKEPIDLFFENVKINAPEPKIRLNRLGLLAQLRERMHIIADFSKIEG